MAVPLVYRYDHQLTGEADLAHDGNPLIGNRLALNDIFCLIGLPVLLFLGDVPGKYPVLNIKDRQRVIFHLFLGMQGHDVLLGADLAL
jgi:hypothetical protein